MHQVKPTIKDVENLYMNELLTLGIEYGISMKNKKVENRILNFF
jgi:hypothetical protein